MKHDDGIVKIYTLTDSRTNGLMPQLTRTLHSQHFFEFRTVSFRRFFEASGVNMQVDNVIRIWEDRSIQTNMLRQIGSEYYRIIQVQHLFDDDNLRVSDLSLERVSDIEEVEL